MYEVTQLQLVNAYVPNGAPVNTLRRVLNPSQPFGPTNSDQIPVLQVSDTNRVIADFLVPGFVYSWQGTFKTTPLIAAIIKPKAWPSHQGSIQPVNVDAYKSLTFTDDPIEEHEIIGERASVFIPRPIRSGESGFIMDSSARFTGTITRWALDEGELAQYDSESYAVSESGSYRSAVTADLLGRGIATPIIKAVVALNQDDSTLLVGEGAPQMTIPLVEDGRSQYSLTFMLKGTTVTRSEFTTATPILAGGARATCGNPRWAFGISGSGANLASISSASPYPSTNRGPGSFDSYPILLPMDASVAAASQGVTPEVLAIRTTLFRTYGLDIQTKLISDAAIVNILA